MLIRILEYVWEALKSGLKHFAIGLAALLFIGATLEYGTLSIVLVMVGIQVYIAVAKYWNSRKPPVPMPPYVAPQLRKAPQVELRAVEPTPRVLITVPVMNGGEELLFDHLRRVTLGHSVTISIKTRVKDVLGRLEILSNEQYAYALKAHFDFVLIHSKTQQPLVAVELDGKSHSIDRLTFDRDRTKDHLCALAGLPLLRIRYGEWHKVDEVKRWLN